MKYNFDEIIDRTNTDSVKWNGLEEEYKVADILPMWVADMDFRSAKEITDAFKDRIDHGVFGYFKIEDELKESVVNWMKKRNNWEIKKDWIVLTPGVVTGLNICVNEFTKKGDKVIIQPPIYPPFYQVLKNNDVKPLDNQLIIEDGKYIIDYDSLEKDIDENTNMIIFCNPQNPTGRVWTEEELERLADICIRKDILVVSDDIHSDLINKGNKYIPIASLSSDMEDNSITFIAPSKTFNIAGLATSVAIIPNEDLRDAFKDNMARMTIPGTNTFGKVGLRAAYEHGENWLEQVLVYMEDNMDYVVDYVRDNIPEIKAYKPEGTYLMWLDFSKLGKTNEELNELLIKEGRILLNDGASYGDGGEGFFRINVGCPRANVEEGMKRIKKVVDSLK